MIARIILKIISLLPPEASHTIMILALHHFPFLAPKLKFSNTAQQKIFNKVAKNAFGIAAGFDKNAMCIPALFRMGFSVVEVGTVTPLPQKGNPKPRIFRLSKNKSVINKMGFPNKGADAALREISKYKRKDGEILGVNIGKNKDGTDEDYVKLIKMFDGRCDYITINISSPNTKGLRDNLETEKFKAFASMIQTACTENHTPLMLKISPDSQNIADICKIASDHNFAGIIAANTTISRDDVDAKWQNVAGGLSGNVLQKKSRSVLQEVLQNANGMTIFSAGGIDCNAEAQKRLDAGASIVQIYTSLIYGAFL